MEPISGIMISTCGSPPLILTATAASRMARACISVISGNVMPRRQPRSPSMGFISCSSSTRASSVRSSFSLGERGLVSSRCWISTSRSSRLRQELVQRRIEQADGDRQRFHGLEEAHEVGALHRQQLLQRVAAVLLVVGQNHGAHVPDAVFGKEHVLGAAEADAFGAEQACLLGIARNVGVGADAAACAAGRPSS